MSAWPGPRVPASAHLSAASTPGGKVHVDQQSHCTCSALGPQGHRASPEHGRRGPLSASRLSPASAGPPAPRGFAGRVSRKDRLLRAHSTLSPRSHRASVPTPGPWGSHSSSSVTVGFLRFSLDSVYPESEPAGQGSAHAGHRSTSSSALVADRLCQEFPRTHPEFHSSASAAPRTQAPSPRTGPPGYHKEQPGGWRRCGGVGRGRGFRSPCRRPPGSSLSPEFTEILFHEHNYIVGHGPLIHAATPVPLPSQEVGR